MFLLIVIPIIATSFAAIAITRTIFGDEPTALQAGISAALTMIIMAPSAWLGHSLAGNIFRHIQPEPVDAAS